MWRPQAKASKPTRRPRLAARSPSARKSAAARSMPPSESGDTLLHTISRSQPSSCIKSNLRSARSKVRVRCGSGMPSKSRNGWKVMALSPRSAISLAMSGGVPLYDSKSLSKNSTPRNPAAAIASSFSLKPPLRQTVAIDVFMDTLSERLSHRSIPRGERSGKCGVHAFDVRLDAGKQPERLGRLMHAHAAAGQNFATLGGSGLDEGSLNRRVDHVGGPMIRAQGRNGHRIPGKAVHADRGGVDDTVGRGDLAFKVA